MTIFNNLYFEDISVPLNRKERVLASFYHGLNIISGRHFKPINKTQYKKEHHNTKVNRQKRQEPLAGRMSISCTAFHNRNELHYSNPMFRSDA